jgi:hypothetical protein
MLISIWHSKIHHFSRSLHDKLSPIFRTRRPYGERRCLLKRRLLSPDVDSWCLVRSVDLTHSYLDIVGFGVRPTEGSPISQQTRILVTKNMYHHHQLDGLLPVYTVSGHDALWALKSLDRFPDWRLLMSLVSLTAITSPHSASRL